MHTVTCKWSELYRNVPDMSPLLIMTFPPMMHFFMCATFFFRCYFAPKVRKKRTRPIVYGCSADKFSVRRGANHCLHRDCWSHRPRKSPCSQFFKIFKICKKFKQKNLSLFSKLKINKLFVMKLWKVGFHTCQPQRALCLGKSCNFP